MNGNSKYPEKFTLITIFYAIVFHACNLFVGKKAAVLIRKNIAVLECCSLGRSVPVLWFCSAVGL